MLTGRLKYYLTLIALLALFGQAGAVANTSCSMMDSGSGQAVAPHVQGMDHSGHAMSDPAEYGNPAATCCSESFCAMSVCLWWPSSAVTAATQVLPRQSSMMSAEYLTSYLNPESISLYRPPIAL